MNRKAIVGLASGATVVLGLGLGSQKAAADSFSVSVHSPSVSVGYGYSDHYGASGFVDVYRPAPAPVYCPPQVVEYRPAPVVVYRPEPIYVPRPVVVYEAPRHVCEYTTRPVSRYGFDECGRRVLITSYVRVRTCDEYHRSHDHGHGHHDDHDRGHGHERAEGHAYGHDRDYYARNWDDHRDAEERGHDRR